jgi:oligoribonuclease NrnB/cAMP/cGMP phosphodiesterase (DHH superfamily)
MGSVIIANKYFNNKIDYILCDTWNLEEVLDNNFENYETIYICDLPIGIDALNIINKYNYQSKIKHFDHHESMINDKNPSFINEVIEINGIKTCGTELFFNYIKEIDSFFDNEFYNTLVHAIRSNDTWNKDDLFNLGHILASIHSIIGPVGFISLINSLDDTHELIIPDVFLNIVKQDEEKMNRYLNNALKNTCICKYKDYSIGVIISEQYRSQLGDYLCNKLNIDFAFIINFERNSVSLRCTRDDIDLGLISLEFHHDGGGHKKAAGFMIDDESIKNIEIYVDEYINKFKRSN